jgi:hypothetical protein
MYRWYSPGSYTYWIVLHCVGASRNELGLYGLGQWPIVVIFLAKLKWLQTKNSRVVPHFICGCMVGL